jgi:transcriptional regulator
MYIPAAFRVDDAVKKAAFIQRHSFATLITHDGAAPFASHLPMLFRADAGPHGTLISHMARANPQWRHFENAQETLAIFHGPHAYISPSWYLTHPSVPTWNYAAVHAYGVPRLIEDHDRIVALLHELITTFEAPLPNPWPGDLSNDYMDKMIQGIVAFEIPLTRAEGKFKLGQNRSKVDLHGVYDGLMSSRASEDRALADLMAAEGLAEDIHPPSS